MQFCFFNICLTERCGVRLSRKLVISIVNFFLEVCKGNMLYKVYLQAEGVSRKQQDLLAAQATRAWLSMGFRWKENYDILTTCKLHASWSESVWRCCQSAIGSRSFSETTKMQRVAAPSLSVCSSQVETSINLHKTSWGHSVSLCGYNGASVCKLFDNEILWNLNYSFVLPGRVAEQD